jgi:molybdenum cofactor guanylyltransferase
MVLILWTGPKHGGKTTSVAELARRAKQDGFRVAGLLAPSIYRDGYLVGFDALDLLSEARTPLTVRRDDPGDAGRFHFMEEGLRLGRQALAGAATDGADLVIVDEFGPLELASGGWRSGVDALVHAGKMPLVIVVRQELADAVRDMYADAPSRVLSAADPASIAEVIRLLKNHRAARGDRMIRLENMLMIGSSGSNVGKTELACALLRKFGDAHRIVGVKVTAAASREQSCPRGGQGCGVCSSMEAEYRITQETDRCSRKDTGRLLTAGADKVYWLRVLRTHLQQGLSALLEAVGRDSIVICESNSLRQVVEPGLFLIVDRADRPAWKQSAQQVRQHADRTVLSDGRSFDLDLDRIRLVGEGPPTRNYALGTPTRWRLTEDATAVVLAGGRSRRMGTDKSMLLIDGQPMIEHICQQLRGTFAKVLISANDTEKFSFLGLEVIPDRIPDQGPLRAVASALEASQTELNLIIGCDIPQIRLPVARRMLAEAEDADVVIPVTEDGKEQPLFAVYRRSIRRRMDAALESGARRLADIYSLCRVRRIELGDADWFANLNTRADYERFRSVAHA